MIQRWDDVQLRGSDPEGSGAFAAPRGGRLHNGVDYCFAQGNEVKSPIEGKVTRIGYAYANEPYRLIEILSHAGAMLWRFLYVDPAVKAGQKVALGQTLGTAQDISKKYSESMKNHVHVEINLNVEQVLGGKK